MLTIMGTELLYPETALAIALLETGHFQSRRMMRDHNWFGFRKSSRRDAGRSYQLYVRNGYGVYASAGQMIRDYQAWEIEVCQRHSLSDERKFRAWIVRHYAEDPHYGIKLRQNLKEIDKTWR